MKNRIENKNVLILSIIIFLIGLVTFSVFNIYEYHSYNKNFNNATKNNDTLEMFLSEHLYEKAIIKDEQQTYQAKKYLLELQRLSGNKAIEKLNLYQYTLKNELLDPTVFKKEQTVQ